MSNQRYTQELKDEAVRQVLVRGHTGADVAERLGVSAHSLYMWVNNADQQANALWSCPTIVDTCLCDHSSFKGY